MKKQPTPQRPQTALDRLAKVTNWIEDQGGISIWQTPDNPRQGRLTGWSVNGLSIVIHEFPGDHGFEVYIPASSSIKIDDTIDALIAYCQRSVAELFCTQSGTRVKIDGKTCKPVFVSEAAAREYLAQIEAGTRAPEFEVLLPLPPSLPVRFDESQIGGAFDGITVTSDADPGL